MGIRIEKVRIQELGPLRQLKLEFDRFNLIYGRNERGKTYLVEFLIRSLFRNIRNFHLRSQTGEGRVEVSGLESETINCYDPLRFFVD